ncbi:hypothetical protein F5Y19DRAFT_160966 [Xylariaceae sp. FL1651]|nr:hypothetical protein F5Y19DRAFT_160966 [Xylariaceae sp. FL1651]
MALSLFFPPLTLGQGSKPGQAPPGDLLHYVERIILEKLEESSEYDDLEKMEDYVNSLSIINSGWIRGYKVDYRFINRCIQSFKSQSVVSVVGMSAGSRTSPSDAGSSSQISHKAGSSVVSGKSTAEVIQDCVPIQITTASGHPRFVVAHKAQNKTQNSISTRVLEENGFATEPGSTINVTLTLRNESRTYPLLVETMDEEMKLSEEALLGFTTYHPDYSLSNYLDSNQTSTVESTSATATPRPACPSSQDHTRSSAESMNEAHNTRPEAHVSIPIVQQHGVSDGREHDFLLDLGKYVLSKCRQGQNDS